MSTSLPWYSFLYRLLGAHGTFWLWLVAIGAAWWTAEGALIRVANREPRAVSVRAATAAEPLARWVRVRGLLLRADRRLLGREGAPTLPPLPLLIDPADPAARWWWRTHAMCEARAGLPGAAALGGLSGLWALRGHTEAVRRLAELNGAPDRFLPAPEQALLVLDPRRGIEQPEPAAPIAASAPGAPAFSGFLARFEEQAALARTRVTPGVELQGVLDRVPASRLPRIREETGIVPSDRLLLVGRRPAEVERIVFMIAVLLLVLLTAGLFGARRGDPDAPADEPGEEPGAPPPDPASGPPPGAEE